MPNKLTNETSPYLLQHANNPVNWYPWGEEALHKALTEDKPIFLSIGYAACHWCHVMAHESFENLAIAEILNRDFISIKVDREERPDLDAIYMNAVVALAGQGGWPMSVFLTPGGEPFYGGTYFPAIRRYGMPSFGELLLNIVEVWRNERYKLLQAGEELADQIRGRMEWSVPESSFDPALIKRAADNLVASYDWENGGWGNAPRFPQPIALEFLLRRAERGGPDALRAATHCLDKMTQGGMYDVIGGGFHRYSTDNRWLIPHFEKMLYDNAQLAQVYLHAYQLSGNLHYRQICEDTLDFILAELTHPEGGFYSSIDADSPGGEGYCYTWTPAEISAALGDSQDAALFCAVYGVNDQGNFEGRTVLQQTSKNDELAKQLNLPVDQVNKRLRSLRGRLSQFRRSRPAPEIDDKVLTAWNALTLSAFARAGRALENETYLKAALRNARFLREHLFQNNILMRSWRKGMTKQPAFLEDIAALIIALIELYQSYPDNEWFTLAMQLKADMLTYYSDSEGGFFNTRLDFETPIVRPKDLQDNATPSANALAAQSLLLLGEYTGDGSLNQIAENLLAATQQASLKYPTAFASWLCAADFAAGPVDQIAILYPAVEGPPLEMINLIHKSYRPRSITAISSYPPLADSPTLLQQRPLIDQKATAYICRGFICESPVVTIADLKSRMATHR
jgi:uncharacterized protein YyaL (SSP411 family)